MANRIVLNNISYHGKGAIQEIVSEVKNNGYQHLFIATDPDLLKFGVTAKVTDILDEAGIAYTIYSKIKPNPTIQNVQEGVEAFKACGADAIVAIGGGSSMDTANTVLNRLYFTQHTISALFTKKHTHNPVKPIGWYQPLMLYQ